MSFPDAHAYAFSLATTLMAVIVIFRAGDGTLSVTPDDGDVTATMDIDRLKLVDIPVANLAKNPEGMLITADGVPAQRDENIKVSGGFLEGSNVSAVSEMMSSIAMNRQFEAQIKMMKTAEDISDAGNRLLRGS